MELLVLDKSFTAIDIIDQYESLIWTDRYNEAGDFEIYMFADKKVIDLLKTDYYLWTKSSDHVMIIEEIQIKTDFDEGNKLIVKGRSLESILDRRVIWEQTKLTDGIQNVIKKLVEDSIINPKIASRKISNFIFDTVDNSVLNDYISVQFTGDNLYEAIVKLCQEKKIGFKVLLDESNNFRMSLYVGEDRTYEQSKNPFVIFSPNYENIVSSNYYESVKEMKNIALVAGQGEGTARKTAIVYKSIAEPDGLGRKEYFTDARDTTKDEEMSDNAYSIMLKERGLKDLDNFKFKKTFEGEMETSKMFVYNRDFFIGDLIQFENEYGIEGKVRVSEIVMNTSTSGYTTVPTLTVEEDPDNLVTPSDLGNTTYNHTNGTKQVSNAYYGPYRLFKVEAGDKVIVSYDADATATTYIMLWNEDQTFSKNLISSTSKYVSQDITTNGYISFRIYLGSGANSETIKDVKLSIEKKEEAK